MKIRGDGRGAAQSIDGRPACGEVSGQYVERLDDQHAASSRGRLPPMVPSLQKNEDDDDRQGSDCEEHLRPKSKHKGDQRDE
ncbi:hypothetical protein ACI2LF_07350 [Kribbella sp. NPDC020789]